MAKHMVHIPLRPNGATAAERSPTCSLEPCARLSESVLMPADEDSFLPHILSVFYAVFDQDLGPTIMYQVPEGLIVNSSDSIEQDASSAPGSLDASVKTRMGILETLPARLQYGHRTLFHFDDIRKFVIPTSALCGRLITCTTRETRVMGFPVALRGKYPRHYFRFNICFVFERTADLSCFEAIVRKVGRVMKSCEEESSFLSSPETVPRMAQVLEQLYEDLNSFAETSITIDASNSLDLKIFPFYPNPPAVNLWDVPVSLINLTKRIEPNWDETMARVCKFIDGVNHVGRIADMADVDEELARQAIAHLLYYQCIMTIDIFQYSNMYTLTKDIRWLVEEDSVQEECGLYVTRPGFPMLDWPQLLSLYSRFRAGVTVFQWQEDNNVIAMGIDVRRFTSFGVIKGFLRRVHRWPYLMQRDVPAAPSPSLTLPYPALMLSGGSNASASYFPIQGPAQPGGEEVFDMPSPVSVPIGNSPEDRSTLGFPAARGRWKDRNLAETYASQTYNLTPEPRSPASVQMQFPANAPPIRRRSSHIEYSRSSVSTVTSTPFMPPLSASLETPGYLRPRMSRSPSTAGPTPYPVGLPELLDGEHHSDELSARFGCGWSHLERYLIAIGGGKDGELGRVKIIYR